MKAGNGDGHRSAGADWSGETGEGEDAEVPSATLYNQGADLAFT
jgi:hypothetical protein